MSRNLLANSQRRVIHVPVPYAKSKTVPYSAQDIAAFWAKVDKSSSACWLWTGRTRGRNGYGAFGSAYAHRMSWEMAHGPIPVGQQVLHACDVPLCVRPDHLFLGTHRQNMEDAARKGRLHVPRPKRQKVSDAEVSQIFTLIASGHTQVYAASRFGVSKTFVSLLVKGKRRQFGSRSSSPSTPAHNEARSSAHSPDQQVNER